MSSIRPYKAEKHFRNKEILNNKNMAVSERKIKKPIENSIEDSKIESHNHKNDLSRLGFSYFPEILKPKIENFDNLPLNCTL